jgi:hypothetical protein
VHGKEKIFQERKLEEQREGKYSNKMTLSREMGSDFIL